MGQHAARPSCEPPQRRTGEGAVEEPLTGFLLRQLRGSRWEWQKVLADPWELRAFSWPRGREAGCIEMSEVVKVETLWLVDPQVCVVPLGARAEAPSGEPTPAGFALIQRNGQELVFCAPSPALREAWLAAFRDLLTLAKQGLPRPAEQQRPAQVVEAMPAGPPASKGKGHGKGPRGPAPPPKAKAEAKPKSRTPRIHGLLESRQPATDVANTIFSGADAAPKEEGPDLAPMLDAFASSRTPSPVKRRSARQDDGVQLIPDRQFAQNLAISMVRVNVAQLALAAASMSPKRAEFSEPRDWEQSENLVDTLASKPDQDPLPAIQAYLQEGKDPGKLRLIEQKLVPLAPIPRVVQRLQLIFLARTLSAWEESARSAVSLLVNTATAVKNCSLMREVVKIIQETLQWNAAPGMPSHARPRVFPVGQQLQRLNTLKPTGDLLPKRFPRYTYVHLLAEVLIFKIGLCLGADPFAEAVGSQLGLAAKANPELAYEELARLRRGRRAAEVELSGHGSSYGPSSKEALPPQVFDIDAEVTGEAVTEIRLEETTTAGRATLTLPPQFEEEPSEVPRSWPRRPRLCRLRWVRAASQPTLEDGGRTPRQPGSFVWLLQPRLFRRPVWEKCWAEVRARHLVLRQILAGDAPETALPLPGCEVMQLTSLLASEVATWLGSVGAFGFELACEPSTDGVTGERIIVCLETAEEAESWQTRLSREASRQGAGWLFRTDVRSSSPAEKCWAVVEEETKQLQCFVDPVDYASGRPPTSSYHLLRQTLTFFEASPGGAPEVAAAAARLKRQSILPAFVIQDQDQPETVGSWTAFGAATPATRRWLEKLQTLSGAGHLRKSYCGALDFEAPRLSWMEDDSPEKVLAPTSPKSKGAALLGASEDEDVFATWARLRPSFCAALQAAKPSERAKSDAADVGRNEQNSEDEESAAEARKDGAENDSSCAESESSEGGDGSEDPAAPRRRLERLARRLRRSHRKVRQVMKTAEEEASELLAFFGEAVPSQRKGALTSLQVFLGNVQAFAKQFASAVQEVKAHHGGHSSGQGRLQRSASLARRIGDEAPGESGRPTAPRRSVTRSLSSGAIRQERPGIQQTRRPGRTKTRHMEPTRAMPSREHPVLLSNQEIKAQLMAPISPGTDPFSRKL